MYLDYLQSVVQMDQVFSCFAVFSTMTAFSYNDASCSYV